MRWDNALNHLLYGNDAPKDVHPRRWLNMVKHLLKYRDDGKTCLTPEYDGELPDSA